MARYVGLDAHSKKSAYVIQNEHGQAMGQGSIATTVEGLHSLRVRHQLPAGTRVALESGTMAFFVARHLKNLGLDPVVVDAYEVRSKALRPYQKSDRRDALELCEGLRRGIYRCIVHIPPEHIERLRDTLRRRRHFVAVKTMQVNAVKHLLRAAGLRDLVHRLATSKAWDRLLAALAPHPSLHAYCSAHRALWECAHQQVQLLEGLLDEEQIPVQEEVERLRTVPGVGRTVALTVIAFLSDPDRFRTGKHVSSYAGLVASTFNSGDRVQHGHITRRGPTELRAMLCEAAHHARRPNHPLNPYFSSLCVRRGYKMAVIAVAHRLCRILYAMLRDKSDFNVAKLAVEEGEFERRTVRRYRRKAGVTMSA
jgi:transposase